MFLTKTVQWKLRRVEKEMLFILCAPEDLGEKKSNTKLNKYFTIVINFYFECTIMSANSVVDVGKIVWRGMRTYFFLCVTVVHIDSIRVHMWENKQVQTSPDKFRLVQNSKEDPGVVGWVRVSDLVIARVFQANLMMLLDKF